MSSFVRVLVLMMTGLGLGGAFDTWPTVERGIRLGATGIDMVSYAIGLLVGMMLWQIGSVRWATLPYRLHKYFVSQMPLYRFVLMGSACILVLIYF